MSFLKLPSFVRALPSRLGFSGREGSGSAPDILDSPLLCLNSHGDVLRWRDAAENIGVFGLCGSGKSSGSGAALARAALSLNWGACVTTTKVTDRDDWMGYVRDAGRSHDDLIIVSPGGPNRCNLADYEWNHEGAGAGQTENVTRLLMAAAEIAGARNDGGSDPYWQQSTTQLVRNTVHLNGLASGHIRLSDMLAIVRSAPKSLDDVRASDSPWRRESFCFQQLLLAGRNAQTEAARLDYDATEAYFLSEFAELAPKTRSIIVQSLTSLLDPFMRWPLRELFCTDTTFTPEDAQRGKIILLDLPVKEWGEIGRIAQVLFKTSFQRATERRDVRKSPVPVLLFVDEAQLFLSPVSDEQFLQTSRAARCCAVYLTQTVSNYYSALGGTPKAQHQAESIMALLSTHFYHLNAGESNEYAAKRIAQTWQMRQGANRGTSSNVKQTGGSLTADTTTAIDSNESQGFSVSEQLGYQVLPQEFTTLRPGGPANGFEVDAIVFKPGRVWNATGTNYMHVTFKQQ
jgi:hypothetical protein